MNKYLLGTAAIAGLLLASAPAQAQMELTIGGHTKNYIGWLDQDTTAATEERNFDMQRETEIHFNGESTLDNGLTFGFQVETEADSNDDANTIEESYIYFSGTWGRVNLGSENGANYLLQVAAPSADSNIDGIRQYINPVNYGITAFGALPGWSGGVPGNTADSDGFDYDNDVTGVSEKITYLSPNMNGFQVGASYTPEVGDAGSTTPITSGFSADDTVGDYGHAYEVAARYEGVFSNFGYAVGAGFTHVSLEETGTAAGAANDDLQEWNVGLDVDSGPFGVGVVYTEGEQSQVGFNDDNVETFVVGVDYTSGPFKFGASYFTQDDETAFAATDLETDRYTAGVVYTAGPGLSFRGSVSTIEHDSTGTDADATSILGGVQINF
ncbi:MAG: porin [Alphaproteobacteria bacterium]|nr:porin [Alphaproteobacteria bacterium]